jgi:hypothetical protein
LTLRRAGLVDVPAVARLIDPPPAADRPGVPDDAVTAAARLLLTHVGLEAGEFWVAADDEGTMRAAVVLLPPRSEPGDVASPEEDAAHAALRLHLGITPPIQPGGSQIPGRHWVLTCVATAGAETALPGLLVRALTAADASGMPVVCPQPGELAEVLLHAGFRSSGPAGETELMTRPVAARALAPTPLRS